MIWAKRVVQYVPPDTLSACLTICRQSIWMTRADGARFTVFRMSCFLSPGSISDTVTTLAFIRLAVVVEVCRPIISIRSAG